jgi:hypothetical protein
MMADPRVLAILGQLRPEDRKVIEQALAPPVPRWKARAARLADRDARIREFARKEVSYPGTGFGWAEAVFDELRTERTRGEWSRGAGRAERPTPADPRRRMMWEILHLNAGDVLSIGAIRRILAGFSCSNSGAELSTSAPYLVSRQTKSAKG